MHNYQFINMDFLNQFTKGDPAKMKKYIAMFLQSAPDAISAMKQHHAGSHWEQLKTTAHALKPQLAYMGIDTLKEPILRIEEYAGEGKNTDLISQLLQTVEETSNKAFVELQQIIDSI